MSTATGSQPALQGVRVVDFSKFLPGPYCGWLLAGLGADVVRLEHPRELEKQARVFGWDRLTRAEREELRARETFSRNKRSLLIDPGHGAAREVILELVRRADVLLEDYRPGVMERMGYGYDAMAAVNPRLVYCSVTLCGQTGPLRDKPGHDPIALSLAGALSRSGDRPERPSFPGVPTADLLTGSNAAIGILAALLARAASGRGQQVDVAMSDASLALIGTVLSRNPDLERVPPRGMQRADSGIWRTRDGRFLCTTDMEPRYWERFCRAIGREEFIPLQLAAERREEITTAIGTIIAQRTLDEWLSILGAAGTQFAPIHDVPAALAEPHHRARGMVFELEGPGGRDLPHLGTPLRMSASSSVPPVPAGLAGRESREILRELGLGDAAIDGLAANGAIGPVWR